MNKLGVATSFFNDKNRNLIRDLVELIIETKQELPSWLEGMAMDIKHQSGGLSRRGGGGGRGGGYVVYSTFFDKSECYANCLFYLDDSLVALDLEITARLRRALVLGVLRDHAAVVDLIPTTMLHLHPTVITRDTLLGISICFLVYFFYYFFSRCLLHVSPFSFANADRTKRKKKKKPSITLNSVIFIGFCGIFFTVLGSRVLSATHVFLCCLHCGGRFVSISHLSQ